jgi:hypothetical protein
MEETFIKGLLMKRMMRLMFLNKSCMIFIIKLWQTSTLNNATLQLHKVQVISRNAKRRVMAGTNHLPLNQSERTV